MLHSTERILVTHTGSLPRPRQLIDMMLAENEGRPVDPAEYEEKLLRAVHDIVRLQMDLGVDVVDDGELSKRGFAVYAHQRLDGLTPTGRVRVSPWDNSRESQAFPEHYGYYSPVPGAKPNPSNMQMACTGPHGLQGPGKAGARIWTNLKAAAAAAGAVEAFVPGHLPVRRGRQRGERVLQERRGVPVRHRGRPAGGVPGHRRRRLPAPNRRSAASSTTTSRAPT